MMQIFQMVIDIQVIVKILLREDAEQESEKSKSEIFLKY